MSIRPTTSEVLEGEKVTVSIIVDNAADIAGGMVTIEFDPSIISVVSVEDGASFTTIAFNYNNTEGFVRMAAASASAIGIDQIIFANITFQGIHPNTSELIFTDARTNCVNGIMSDAAFNNGEITVIPRPVSIAISQEMAIMYVTDIQQFTAIVSPLDANQEVTWSVDNEAFGTINATGHFNAIARGNVTITATSVIDGTVTATATVEILAMPGDLNDDGQLDSGDATLALQMAIGELPENLLGDLNGNGELDTGDATRMLQGSL